MGQFSGLQNMFFSVTLITRKCSVSHQEVKINYFDKF